MLTISFYCLIWNLCILSPRFFVFNYFDFVVALLDAFSQS